jgi:hypothetical protein
VPRFGSMIFLEPAIVLAQIPGDGFDEIFRAGDVAFGGVDRVEDTACTRHDGAPPKLTLAIRYVCRRRLTLDAGAHSPNFPPRKAGSLRPNS